MFYGRYEVMVATVMCENPGPSFVTFGTEGMDMCEAIIYTSACKTHFSNLGVCSTCSRDVDELVLLLICRQAPEPGGEMAQHRWVLDPWSLQQLSICHHAQRCLRHPLNSGGQAYQLC